MNSALTQAATFAPAKCLRSSPKPTSRRLRRAAPVRAAISNESASELSLIIAANSAYPTPETRSTSFARAHFSEECEKAINDQINIEYNVSYIYHGMYSYYSRDNVALLGFAAFFKHGADEEREHAELLMDYQVMRGGRVELQALLPVASEFSHPNKSDALHGMEVALSLEKINNDKLIALHRVAEEANDSQMCDFVEGSLLADQVKSIQEVSEMVAQLRMMGDAGDALWHFDQKLLKQFGATA